MAVSLEQFRQQLAASALMSAADIQAFLAAFGAIEQPQNGEQLARLLISQKKLTTYQVEQIHAGQGGMGMVLKAQHRRMNRLVAIKVLAPASLKSPDLVKRFHREVEAAAKLEHPNIVTAHDADEANGVHFLVMQFVEGEDLSALVRRQGPLSPSQSIDCILQVARGLDYAHKQGVIHRDIKPSNLLLSKEGTVKILDMGLARIDDQQQDHSLTGTGTVMGTVDYMSPEQALNTKLADAKSDQYSLGITLYFLLTGKPAYAGSTVMEKLVAHREAPLPLLQHSTGELNAIFQKMIAKKPADRFESMADVIAALTAMKSSMENEPTASFSPMSTPQMPSSTTQRDAALQASLQQPASKTGPKAATSAGTAARTTAASAAVSAADAATMISSAATDETATSLQATKPSQTGRGILQWAGIAAAVLAGIGLLGWLAAALLSENRLNLAADKTKQTVLSSASDNQERTSQPHAAAPIQDAVKHTLDVKVERPGTTYALEFNGIDNSVEVPSLVSDLKHPFTLEGWVSVSQFPPSDSVALFGWQGVAMINLGPAGDVTGMAFSPEGQVVRANPENVRCIPLRQFQHVALVRDGNLLRAFVGGNSEPTATLPEIRQVTGFLWARNDNFAIGCEIPVSKSPDLQKLRFLAGRMREVRISKVARYDRAFVPATRFDNDDDTLALYHFDEGRGDQLIDSSDHGHHGKIIGAKWVTGNRDRPQTVEMLTQNDAHSRAALDFQGDLAEGMPRIEPKALFDPALPATVEFWITPRSRTTPDTNRLLFGGGLMLKEYDDGWQWHGKSGTELIFERGLVKPHRRTHLAGVSTGRELFLFVDGKLANRRTLSEPIGAWKTGALLGGLRQSESKWEPLDAVVDQFRYSKTARYDREFQPPDRMASDDQTLILYNFDEGQGDLLADASGNNHHGKIVGAKWVRTNVGPGSSGWHGWPADAPKPAIAPFDAAQAKKHQEEWAAYLRVPVEYTNSIGMKFRLIPPGEFLMGSTPEEIEEALNLAREEKVWHEYFHTEAPQHRVILSTASSPNRHDERHVVINA